MKFDLDLLNKEDRKQIELLIEEYENLQNDEDDIRLSDDQYEDFAAGYALAACEEFYKKCFEKEIE